MNQPPDFRALGCAECVTGDALDFDFTMAFQPIVDVARGEIFAYEALARGLDNEPAGHVFQHVNDGNRYRFDQTCRVKAVALAAELGVECQISINFMPNAVYRPELCIRTTLAAAEQYGFPVERIIFEFTESEHVDDKSHLKGIVDHYQQRGFKTAIDDFGAGYAGLNFLAEIQSDIIKLDMALIRNIHTDRVRQSIVKGIVSVCGDLDITVIAEGIECREEMEVLRDRGVELFQGYYFARPGFRSLPAVDQSLLG